MSATTKKANIRMIFSQNLCFLMEQKGITRRGLSRDLDIKYTTLCDWVNGRTIPREDQLDRLGRYFGIESGEFFIDFEQDDAVYEHKRLSRYVSGTRRLDMNVLDHMSDEQIRDLINSGFTFSFKSVFPSNYRFQSVSCMLYISILGHICLVIEKYNMSSYRKI